MFRRTKKKKTKQHLRVKRSIKPLFKRTLILVQVTGMLLLSSNYVLMNQTQPANNQLLTLLSPQQVQDHFGSTRLVQDPKLHAVFLY